MELGRRKMNSTWNIGVSASYRPAVRRVSLRNRLSATLTSPSPSAACRTKDQRNPWFSILLTASHTQKQLAGACRSDSVCLWVRKGENNGGSEGGECKTLLPDGASKHQPSSVLPPMPIHGFCPCPCCCTCMLFFAPF